LFIASRAAFMRPFGSSAIIGPLRFSTRGGQSCPALKLPLGGPDPPNLPGHLPFYEMASRPHLALESRVLRLQPWAAVSDRGFNLSPNPVLPRLLGQPISVALFENAHDGIEQHIAPISNSIATEWPSDPCVFARVKNDWRGLLLIPQRALAKSYPDALFLFASTLKRSSANRRACSASLGLCHPVRHRRYPGSRHRGPPPPSPPLARARRNAVEFLGCSPKSANRIGGKLRAAHRFARRLG
jgi:hypothetical protein